MQLFFFIILFKIKYYLRIEIYVNFKLSLDGIVLAKKWKKSIFQCA